MQIWPEKKKIKVKLNILVSKMKSNKKFLGTRGVGWDVALPQLHHLEILQE